MAHKSGIFKKPEPNTSNLTFMVVHTLEIVNLKKELHALPAHRNFEERRVIHGGSTWKAKLGCSVAEPQEDM